MTGFVCAARCFNCRSESRVPQPLPHGNGGAAKPRRERTRAPFCPDREWGMQESLTRTPCRGRPPFSTVGRKADQIRRGKWQVQFTGITAE